jgi:hypothetical protein
MASCYLCGKPKASHRRWVDTGASTGTFVSRRSFGVSVRQYTGLRTVCDTCAASLDAHAAKLRRSLGNTLAFIVVATIIGTVALMAFAHMHPLVYGQ